MYQAQFRNGSWFGQINCVLGDADGTLSAIAGVARWPNAVAGSGQLGLAQHHTFNPATSTYTSIPQCQPERRAEGAAHVHRHAVR